MDEKNMDFWNIYIKLLHYPLSAREMNYLIWKFYNRKNYRQIAWLDGQNIKKSAVSMVISRACRKIKVNFKKL
jgi:hypothetical protein